MQGVGSVFTNSDLTQAALAVLEPLYRNENAYDAWLKKGAFDIVQPDVTKVGGHQRVAPHCLDGPGKRHPLYPPRLEYGGGTGG